MAGGERRYSLVHLAAAVAASMLLAASVWTAVLMFPKGAFVFHAPWLLHPFEQEHLSIARNLAHGGGLTIRGDGSSQFLGSEDRGFINGNYVPRSVLLPYLIYAPTFLVSDSAWLVVTPVFGVLGAVAAGLIVFARTRNVVASVSCIAVMSTGAMYLLASSGVAYDSVIALAFLLWGVVALEAFLSRPSALTAVAAGLLFAAAADSRADYAPAVALVLLYLAGWVAIMLSRHQGVSRRLRLSALATLTAGVSGLGIAAILATDYAITGDPLHSAYGAGDWQGSADGLARGLTTFTIGDFVAQARLFLWDIGRPTLPLFAVWVVARINAPKLAAGDFVLVGLSAFLVVYNLGREGSHSSDAALLVASPPRYILPAYATAAVVAFTALPDAFDRIRADLPLVATPLLLSIAVLASAQGLGEAYTNKAGLGTLEDALKVHRKVHEFSEKHQDALFVGDLNTKAIIVSQRLLAPRLVNAAVTTQLVAAALDAGRPVYLVDDPRQLENQPLYSGYLETLSAAGYATCAITADMPVISQVVSLASAEVVGAQAVPANNAGGVETPALEAGETYYFVISGTYAYNASGSDADGMHALVGERPAGVAEAPEHRYCLAVTGKGGVETVKIADKAYSDNSGALDLKIYKAAD